MGRSATALLFWGASIEEYGEMDDNYKTPRLQPDWWYEDRGDWERYITRDVPVYYEGMTDQEYRQRESDPNFVAKRQSYWDRCQELKSKFKCDLQWYGHLDGESLYFVHHNDLMVCGDYYELTKINMADLVQRTSYEVHQYEHDLMDFLDATELKIDWDTVGWHLTAHYG